MTTITIPKALLEQALEKLLECWPKSDPCINGIRAERAKPVEQAEPVAWMWQHEETGRTGFIETSLAKDWAKLNPRQPLVMPVYKHPPTPSWHDAPTCAGLWLCNYGILEVVCINQPDVDNFDDFYNAGGRWYGPIPQDAKAEGDAIRKGE